MKITITYMYLFMFTYAAFGKKTREGGSHSTWAASAAAEFFNISMVILDVVL